MNYFDGNWRYVVFCVCLCVVGIGLDMNFSRINTIGSKLKEVTLLNAQEFDDKADECMQWVKEILIELEKDNIKPYP